MKEQVRYFTDSDGDGHWYVVPESKRKQWNAWTSIDTEDPRAWKIPDYARPIGGHPNMITFLDPK